MANLYLDSPILSKNKFTSVPYPMEQVSLYRIAVIYQYQNIHNKQYKSF